MFCQVTLIASTDTTLLNGIRRRIESRVQNRTITFGCTIQNVWRLFYDRYASAVQRQLTGQCTTNDTSTYDGKIYSLIGQRF